MGIWKVYFCGKPLVSTCFNYPVKIISNSLHCVNICTHIYCNVRYLCINKEGGGETLDKRDGLKDDCAQTASNYLNNNSSCTWNMVSSLTDLQKVNLSFKIKQHDKHGDTGRRAVKVFFLVWQPVCRFGLNEGSKVSLLPIKVLGGVFFRHIKPFTHVRLRTINLPNCIPT